MSESEGQVLTQYEENCDSSNGSSQINVNSTESNISDGDDAPILTHVAPLAVDESKDRDSRKIKNLKAKLDRVVSKSASLKETLILDHAKSLEKVADECKSFTMKIVDLERKNIRLTEKLTCTKSTHKHQIEMLKDSLTSKTEKLNCAIKVCIGSFFASICVL